MFFAAVFIAIMSAASAADMFNIVPDPRLTAFRRVGNLVDGVAHAHIAFRFNLTAEAYAVRTTEKMLRNVSGAHARIMTATVLQEAVSLEGDWDEFLAEIDQHRKKRQVLVAALGAAVVVSAGAGAFAIYETEQLGKKVKADEKRVDHLFAAVNSSILAERKIINNLSLLKKKTLSVSNELRSVEDVFALSTSSISSVNRLKQRLVGFKNLWKHNLSPALLAPQQLLSSYKLLQRRISAAGFQTVVEGLRQLHRCETSYSIQAEELVVFVHVPVTARGGRSRMVLLEHVQLPVRINGSLGVVKAQNTLLAMPESEEEFVEISHADLQTCDKRGSDYSCSVVFPRSRGGGDRLFASPLPAPSGQCGQVVRLRAGQAEEHGFPVQQYSIPAGGGGAVDDQH